MGWTERAIYGAQGELGEARDDGGGARTRRARTPSRARLKYAQDLSHCSPRGGEDLRQHLERKRRSRVNS